MYQLYLKMSAALKHYEVFFKWRKQAKRLIPLSLLIFLYASSSGQVSISGTVYYDTNALLDNTVNGAGTNAGGLNAVLYDTTLHKVSDLSAVAGDGTYSFSSVGTGDVYRIYITTNSVLIGQTAVPSLQLPFNWGLTGEYLGTGTGNDGKVDGRLLLGVVSSNISNANFGIWQICSGGTIYAISDSGFIRPLVNPALSGVLGSAVNSTYYPATSSANCLGYDPANGKFYFFQNSLSGTLAFACYDPSTNSYSTLTAPASTVNILRAGVDQTGTGYYCLDGNGELWYYSITNNTWTAITSTYYDQLGNNISSQLSTNGSGDLAIDGSGNLWMLAGNATASTCYVFKISGPLPTTTVTSLTAKLLATNSIGSKANGIAFSSAGEVYITTTTTNSLYRLNNDYTVTTIGTITGGYSRDLTSCAFPLNPLSALDYGDAPDSYGTLQSGNGPRHSPSYYDAGSNTALLMLGSAIDIENDGAPSVNADGDDLAGIDDENGVTYFPVLPVNATTYTVTVNVTNNTGVSAYLSGWIDFNRNGVFDAGEKATATVANGATSAILTWNSITGLTTGSTYCRFRIATNAAEVANPTGAAGDGEVEDYHTLIIGYAISGNVYDDVNALADNTVNGTGTNAGGLNAVLYDNSTGRVAAVTAVASDGTYNFSAAPGENYTIYITTNNANAGDASTPVTTLPAGWVNTGENLGAGPGNDGTADGILTIGTLNGNITYADFGIHMYSVLPVTLTSLQAAVDQENVLLVWSVASGANVSSFQVLRSSDGIHWSAVGNVPANTFEVDNSYHFTDAGAASGINYYRVRTNFSNGNFIESKTVTADIRNTGNNILIGPDPATTQLQIRNMTSISLVKIYDMRGNVLLSQASGNVAATTLNISRLGSGIYYIACFNTDGKMVEQAKFLKINK